MGRGGHASGYTPIKDATEMGSTHSSEGDGHGGGHGKHGHGGGKEGERGVRGKFVSLACVFLAACFLAAIFDEPMSMKAEERAVARGTATMVVEHGRTAGLRAREPEAAPRAAAPSRAASTRPVSGMVLSEGQAPPEGPHSFRFRVPHNAAPGSIMHIMVPGGKELHDVKIPENAKPGDMMFLTLPSGEGAAAAAKEGGDKEGEEGDEKEGGGEEEENPLTEEEMRALIGEDMSEVPEEVEELTTFKGQKDFWRHWFLCVITFFIGAMLVGYAVRGVFHGLGPIEVDPRKLPDHPGRFNDAKIAELAMGHMDMYGDEPQVSVSARGSSLKSPRDSRSPAQSPRVTAGKPGSNFPGATPKDAELDGGDAEDDDVVTYHTILEEARSEEMWLEVWNRGKWLLVLLIFQSTSSIVLASFEELIKHHLALTLFLTMLVGAGGNAGAQSVVKDISLIAAGHTPGSKKEWQRALIRTGIMAIALALGLGLAGYFRVFFFQGTGQEALAIAVSCGIIVFSGIVVGT